MKRAISIALAILVLSGAALGRPDDLIRSVILSTAGPVYFGQTVDITMRAAAGGQASWFLGPRYGPMRERAPGVYGGSYRVRKADSGLARIRVTLFMPDGRTAVRDLGSVALDGSSRAVVRSRSTAFVSQDVPAFPEQVMAQISPPPGPSPAVPYGFVSRPPLAAVPSYSIQAPLAGADDYAVYQPPYYGLGVPYSVPMYAVAADPLSYPYVYDPYGATSYAYNPFGVTSSYPYVYDPYGVTSSYFYPYTPSGVTSSYYSYAYNPFGVTSSYFPYANAPYGTPLSSPGYGYSGGLGVRLDSQGISAAYVQPSTVMYSVDPLGMGWLMSSPPAQLALTPAGFFSSTPSGWMAGLDRGGLSIGYAPRAVFLAPAQPLPVLAAYRDASYGTFATSVPSLATYAPNTVYRASAPPYGKAWGYWAKRAPYAAVSGAYSGVPRVEIDDRHGLKPPLRPAATWVQAPRYASATVPPHGQAAGPRYASTTVPTHGHAAAPRSASTTVPTHGHAAAPRYSSTSVPPHGHAAAPRYANAPRSAYTRPAPRRVSPPAPTLRYSPPAQVRNAAPRYTAAPPQVHSAPRYTAPPPQVRSSAPRYTPPTTQGGGASRPSGGSGGGPRTHGRRH